MLTSQTPQNEQVIGCIYKYLQIDLKEGCGDNLTNLLNNFLKENKSMFLLGDFTRKVLAQAVSQQKFWNHVFKFLDGISFSVYIWIPEKHLTYLQWFILLKKWDFFSAK